MASNLTFNDDGSMDLDATAGHISPHHVRTDSCISQQEVVDLISPTDAAARTGLKHAGGIAHDVDLPTDLQLSDLDSNDDNGTQAFIPIAPFPAQDGTQAFAPIVPLEVQDTTRPFVPIAPYQTEGRALAIPQPVSTQAQDDTLAFAPITSFLAQHNAPAFAVCPPLPGASSIPSGFDYYHVEQPGPRSFSAPYGQQDLCPQKGRPKKRGSDASGASSPKRGRPKVGQPRPVKKLTIEKKRQQQDLESRMTAASKRAVELLQQLGKPFENTIEALIDCAAEELDGKEGVDGDVAKLLNVAQTWKAEHKERLKGMERLLAQCGVVPFRVELNE